MKKECIPVMGFRHSHIGINFPSKRIYIYIYIGRVSFDIEFKSYWNLDF